MKKAKLTLYLLLICGMGSLQGQISQSIINGSNSNTIYQSFNSEEGGTLQSIKISTDNVGGITLRLFEKEKQITSKDPLWEVVGYAKNQSGELVIDLSEGSGKTRRLKPNTQYSYSVVGAGNIHHSFLEDTYPKGNIRFEDGIERKGDLFFEIQFVKEIASFKSKVPKKNPLFIIYPNPSSQDIRIKNLESRAEIKIYNSQGRLAKTQYIMREDKISVHDLSPGNYYVVIKTKGVREVKKLVVSKP